MKLENHSGSKMTVPFFETFFIFPAGIFRVFGKFELFLLRFFIFLRKPKSEKILFYKSQAKMFLSNEIGRILDHQYLWKKSIDISDFLNGESSEEKNIREVVAQNITFGWALPGVPSHAQTCLDLLRCIWLICTCRGCIARLRKVHNERLSDF